MAAPQPPYTITNVQQTRRPGPGPQVRMVTLVTYVLDNGYVGELTLAGHGWTAERIKPELEADIARVRGIFKL